MGVWGDQPLENDTAWGIIGSITDTVIQAIAAIPPRWASPAPLASDGHDSG